MTDINTSGSDEVNIRTILRIKPSKTPSGYFKLDELHQDVLHFYLPENFKSKDEYINNTKLHHWFQFNGIVPMNSTQAEVFKQVGTECVTNALDGYNSTIFTYGQTGSGKTFTLTGGSERYEDRGIIPRAISMLFNEMKQGKDRQFKFYISYLEIYNDECFDLLAKAESVDPKTGVVKLPKSTILEDDMGNFHIKNLSVHLAESEEDALNLLFEGDTNRAVAETPMNLESSRSHCIFTISIEGRSFDSEKVRRSKLHLVDLAGSERVAKTNSSGVILQQARHINSSLFYLEMVIVALYEKATKGRTHIPYRNSTMTSILRDSLGGNCKTVMIATINPEASHTDESLSTCRFAKRVSMIKNKATINEDLDPTVIIKKLKDEMLNMREEIDFLKGEAGEGEALTPLEIEELKKKCKDYCDSMDPYAILDIGKLTLTKIKDVFAIMKNLVLEERAKIQSNVQSSDSTSEKDEDLLKKLDDLQASLLQRDNEIAVLVSMVKKAKKSNGNADIVQSTPNVSSKVSGDSTSSTVNSNHVEIINSSSSKYSGPQIKSQREREQAREELIIKRHLFGVPPPSDKRIFEDAAASFEWFRDRCSLNQAMEENRDLLKNKIQDAKVLGEKANQSRNTITYLKNSIEKLRKDRAVNDLTGDTKSEVDVESEEEKTYRKAIEQEKIIYKESFEKLRDLKPEIENIRKLLENSRVKLQSQFDEWYNTLHTRNLYDNTASPRENNNESNISTVMSNASGFTGKESLSSVSTESRRYEINDGSKQVPFVKVVPTIAASKDSDVNSDIMAFYQAKEELMKRKGKSSKPTQ